MCALPHAAQRWRWRAPIWAEFEAYRQREEEKLAAQLEQIERTKEGLNKKRCAGGVAKRQVNTFTRLSRSVELSLDDQLG